MGLEESNGCTFLTSTGKKLMYMLTSPYEGAKMELNIEESRKVYTVEGVDSCIFLTIS
jgi:hypothetical protein